MCHQWSQTQQHQEMRDRNHRCFDFEIVDAMCCVLQSLLGNLDDAVRTFQNYYSVWRQFGGLPEFYSIPQGYTVDKREGYPLRPGQSTDQSQASSEQLQAHQYSH